MIHSIYLTKLFTQISDMYNSVGIQSGIHYFSTIKLLNYNASHEEQTLPKCKKGIL